MSAFLEGAVEGNVSKVRAELGRGANIDYQNEVKCSALVGLPHYLFVEPLFRRGNHLLEGRPEFQQQILQKFNCNLSV